MDLSLLPTKFLLFTVCLLRSASADYQLRAVFSMSGIKGDVVFTQSQPDGPTSIMVNLTGVNENLGWAIHQLPMIYDGNAAMSCNAGAVGQIFDPKMAQKAASYESECDPSKSTRFDTCAVGDLWIMLGNLTANMTAKNYSDENLIIPLHGPYSIMSRTLVLYKESSSTPRACALITSVLPMRTAVAVFKAPVAGFIYLRQVDENSDTAVYVNLFYVESSESANLYKWQIDQGLVSDDFTDHSSYCNPAGHVFNPDDSDGLACNQTNQNDCPIGDLSSKHGNINVSVATQQGSSTPRAFVDTYLPLFGTKDVIGKSIVLFSVSEPSKPVACAKILKVNPRVFKATFEGSLHEGVSGYYKFTQQSPFDPTKVEISISGLEDAKGYHVHKYPSPRYKNYSLSESCSGDVAGGHWNPLGIDVDLSPPSGTGTNDEYEIGDLSGKYGSFLNLTTYNEEHIDYNLPLFGKNSIQGRSVVIHKREENRRWVCSNLIQDVDAVTTFAMRTSAKFEGPDLSGMILIDQYKSSLQNAASEQTTIFIDVSYTDDASKQTEGHRWDVHLDPVGNDADVAENNRCLSLKENFNPFQVDTGGDYSSVCSSTNMLRCELGDLSGKHKAYAVGGGRDLFNDINLPLFGPTSVAGRGIAIRSKDSGSTIIGCANVYADSSLFVEKQLVDVHQPDFLESDFVKVVANKLSIPKWRIFNVRTEKGEFSGCHTIKFGIIGTADQNSGPSDRLDDIVGNRPSELGDYKPRNEKCEEPKPESGTRDNHEDSLLSVMAVACVVVVKVLMFV